MKTKLFILALFVSVVTSNSYAQDKTTVTATNTDISDNLDLRAVASLFGESENLEAFERKLNDPKTQISNLDLNNDNQVDYLRVIESVEGNTHLIIIQAVLEKDVFQDIATVEVEKDSNNQVQVQVVGDTYIYGSNYIYEPVYVYQPVIYDYFWMNSYRPYYSSWYYGYYPNYYYGWNPYPIYRYRNNVNVYINTNNHYNYVNVRRSSRAASLYSTRRANGYELRNPNRSFAQRNTNVKNRYELDQTRSTRDAGTRTNTASPRSNNATGTRTSTNTRNNNARTDAAGGTRATTPRTKAYTGTKSVTTSGGARANTNTRTDAVQSTPNNSGINTPRTQSAPKSSTNTSVRTEAPKVNPQPGMNPQPSQAPRVSAPQQSSRASSQPSVQPQRSTPQSAPAGNSARSQSGGGRR